MNKTIANQTNKVTIDKFGRKSGILLLNKPAQITSHDLVNKVRKKLKERKVGHAGTLDPFATGLMIILVGKATKLSNHFLNQDKEYRFNLVLGISTNTLDPEGSLTTFKPAEHIKVKKAERAVLDFKGEYDQYVPIYSSIKVNGFRLRELAHSSKKHKIYKKNDYKVVKFFLDEKTKVYRKLTKRNRIKNKNEYKLKVPKREVMIKEIEVLKIQNKKSGNIDAVKHLKANVTTKIIQVRTCVSKGTYIRQLAVDIGNKLEIPAMLSTLTRTKIGKYKIENAVDIENLETFLEDNPCLKH